MVVECESELSTCLKMVSYARLHTDSFQNQQME